MADHDLIIVGGGISGMSLAYFCAKAGLRPVVLEKNAAVGGCMHSHRLDDGFWFELGAHTCYNSYTTMLGILEERPGLSELLPREKVPFRLYVDGEVRTIPSQLKILQLLASAPRLFFSKKPGRTVREYYSGIVGGGNYDRVFGPVFAAVPSQRADEFPAEMLFKKRQRRKDVLRSFTLKGGLQSATDAMAKTPGVEIRVGAEVRTVRRIDGGAEVALADGTTLRAKNVALAAPPSVGAVVLRDAFPEVAAALARIKVTPIHSIGVVVKKEDVPVEPVAGIIPLDWRFFSAVSRDTVTDARHRGFAFHFGPGTTRDAGLEVACGVLKVDRAKVERVVEREVVLPSPRVGHEAIVADLERGTAGTPLLITGNYFGGLSLEDCVIRSKAEAERLVRVG